MVTLITGGKNAGKSSYLYDWFCKEPVGYGVLSMKRYVLGMHQGYDLLFLPSEVRINLCSKIPIDYVPQKDDIIQGNYLFDPQAFESACHFMISHLTEKDAPIWLDEVGNLEMSGKGFTPIIKLLCPAERDLRIGVRFSCIYGFTKLIGDNHFHVIYTLEK